MIQWYAKEVEKHFGDDAECRPWINLYSFNACQTDVFGIVQRSIVFVILEEHVLSCDSNNRYFQLCMMTFRTRGLSVVPRDFWHMCQK